MKKKMFRWSFTVILMIMCSVCLNTQVVMADTTSEGENTESATLFGVRNFAEGYYLDGIEVTQEEYYERLREEVAIYSSIRYDDETLAGQNWFDNYVLEGYTPIADGDELREFAREFIKPLIGPEETRFITASGVTFDELFQITHVDPFTHDEKKTLYQFLYPYVSYTVSSSSATISSGKISRFTFYHSNGSELDSYEECIEIAKQIVEPIRGKDRYTQIKYINDYLCDSITYSNDSDACNLKDALINKVAHGRAYALAFQLCMEELGIPSYIIDDYCYYFLNAVELDGKWYWVSSGKADSYSTTNNKYFLYGTNIRANETDLSISSSSYKSASQQEETIPTYSYKDLDSTMYAKDAVNVRDLPSTAGKKVGSLEMGDEIKVTGKCNESSWYRIEYNGGVAYVSSKYLVDEKPVESIEPSEAPEVTEPTESELPSEEPDSTEPEMSEEPEVSEEPETPEEPEVPDTTEEPVDTEMPTEPESSSELEESSEKENQTESGASDDSNNEPEKKTDASMIRTILLVAGIVLVVGIGIGVYVYVDRKNTRWYK